MKLPSVIRDLANSAIDAVSRIINRSIVDPCRRFPAFAPNSQGAHWQRSQLTIESVNNTFVSLNGLCHAHFRNNIKVVQPLGFVQAILPSHAVDFESRLKKLLDMYGSDKAQVHDYHFIYAAILEKNDNFLALLEIGLGSNNKNIVSNMNGGGYPGGSLRAFRDYLPSAKIFGADIDPMLLFSEDRIETFVADQLSIESLESLGEKISIDFDLVIDDGLHSPNANINTVNFGLSRLKPYGWLVVEDIACAAIPVWHVVASLLAPKYDCYLVDAKGGWLFVVHNGGT